MRAHKHEHHVNAVSINTLQSGLSYKTLPEGREKPGLFPSHCTSTEKIKRQTENMKGEAAQILCVHMEKEAVTISQDPGRHQTS